MKRTTTAILILFCSLCLYTHAQVVDSTFGIDGIVPQTLGNGNNTVIQPDGKILVSIDKSDPNSTSDYGFWTYRYNTDGSPDTTFGTAGGASGVFTGWSSKNKNLKLQSDGKIIVVGESRYCTLGVCGAPQFVMMRLKTNGIVDSTFGYNGVVLTSDVFGSSGLYANPERVEVISGNKFIIAGRGSGGKPFVGRMKNNGTMDSTFAVNGIAADTSILDQLVDMAIDSSGSIYSLCSTYDYPGDTNNVGDNFIIKVTANGSPDLTFGTGGRKRISIGNYDQPASIAVRSDGKIVVTGTIETSHQYGYGVDDWGFVCILNPDGSMSNVMPGGSKTFRVPDDSTLFLQKVIIGDNNKMFLGGRTITKIAGNYHERAFVAEMNENGTLDTSFNHSGYMILDYGFHSTIGSLCSFDELRLLPNNKLLATGYHNVVFGTKKYLYMTQLKGMRAPAIIGIEDISSAEVGISVYPNPTHTYVTIQTTTEMHNATIQCIDATGRIVSEKNAQSGNSFGLDLRGLATGSYIVKVYESGHTERTKFVKE